MAKSRGFGDAKQLERSADVNAKSKHIQNGSFTAVMALYYIVYEFCGGCTGHARPMYAMKIVMESTCLCLFVWWWAKQGKASTVYMWIVILFAGMIYSDSIEYYVRTLVIVQHSMIPFQTEIWWITRDMPVMLVLAFLFAFILGRIFGEGD
jgi:hypothetical protein